MHRFRRKIMSDDMDTWRFPSELVKKDHNQLTKLWGCFYSVLSLVLILSREQAFLSAGV